VYEGLLKALAKTNSMIKDFPIVIVTVAVLIPYPYLSLLRYIFRVYSVSQKITPPCSLWFCDIFSQTVENFKSVVYRHSLLHGPIYAIDYKFLFDYLQL